jgi:rhamnosyltransferase
VVDSSSSDDTVRIAESFGAQVVTIRKQDFNHGTTRNLGASLATGNVLVFLTQDALPCDNRLLEELLDPLRKGCVATYGRQLAGPDATPPERFARLFNYPEMPAVKEKGRIGELGIKTFFFSNACSAVRKEIFVELEGFPETIMDEDLLFSAKAIMTGHEVAYAPSARVVHYHNYSLADQLRRYFDIGVFFDQNQWLLAYSALSGEGKRFVRDQLVYLMRMKAYRWVPYAFGEILSKYVGYRLGRSHRFIPRTLKKRLSMHKGHWESTSERSEH